MFNSILNDGTIASISFMDELICIVVAFFLGGVISFTHKITTKTTHNFLLTLAILPVLVQIVILLINGNLGTSVAVAGAFSLVRFRSLPRNSKEIISVFWAMAVGLALGMGYIAYAVVFTIIIAVIIIIINKLVISNEEISRRKLKIVIPENMDYDDIFKDIFEKYTNKAEINKVKTTNMGSMYELSYYVELKKNINQKSFLDEIRCRNGNLLVMLEREEIGEVEL